MSVPTVLFICRSNGVASPMAEAIVNHRAEGRLRAFSAGIEPVSRIHPEAVAVLVEAGIAADDLQPKAIELFGLPQAPHPDLVVTLTGEVLGRSVAPWQSAPRRLAWLIADPAEADDRGAFRRLLADITTRIERTFLKPLSAETAATRRIAGRRGSGEAPVGPRRGGPAPGQPAAPQSSPAPSAARRASS